LIVVQVYVESYALSGARAAYLCAGPHQLEELRAITRLGRKLRHSSRRFARSMISLLRGALRRDRRVARGIGPAAPNPWFGDHPGIANFILTHLPPEGPERGHDRKALPPIEFVFA